MARDKMGFRLMASLALAALLALPHGPQAFCTAKDFCAAELSLYSDAACRDPGCAVQPKTQSSDEADACSKCVARPFLLIAQAQTYSHRSWELVNKPPRAALSTPLAYDRFYTFRYDQTRAAVNVVDKPLRVLRTIVLRC